MRNSQSYEQEVVTAREERPKQSHGILRLLRFARNDALINIKSVFQHSDYRIVFTYFCW